MKKTVFFILLLVAVLALSGCSSLIKRDADVDGRQAVISVNGEEISKQSFLNVYNYNLSSEQYSAQMMAQFGLGDGSVDTAQVAQTTVQNYITKLLIDQKAAELGLDQFTDEETASLEEQAQQRYQDQLENLRQSLFAGRTPAQQELDAAAASQGYSLESARTYVRSAAIAERVRDYAAQDVHVDESALQSALEEKIQTLKERFETSANALNTAANGNSKLLYVPEGYRLIRVYMVASPADENAEENREAIAAQAAEMHARAAAGEPMDGLDVTEAEYRITGGSTLPTADVAAAAMALPEKGNVTDVIATDTAAWVAVYVDDLAPYTATLEDARDEIYDEVLTAAKNDAYNAAMKAWSDEADIQLFLDRLD